VTALWVGTDHTAIHVAMSGVFQEAALQPWTDLGSHLAGLAATGRLRVDRTLG
jgi:hypothetical protein